MAVGVVCAENWPGWRGPRGDGTSLEDTLPIRWSGTDNVLWKLEVAGEGHSSPIIWNELVFLTTALEGSQERCLLAIDQGTGALRWQQTVLRAPLEDKNNENSYASATPATDGENVYVTFLDRNEVLVAAFDFSGKQVWLARPGGFQSQWGFSHSPVLCEDKVILVCYSKGENFVAALSKADGRVLWKTPGAKPTQSYSAPLLREMDGRLQLVAPGNNAVTSYDPRTGKVFWVVDGPSMDFVVTPVYSEQADLIGRLMCPPPLRWEIGSSPPPTAAGPRIVMQRPRARCCGMNAWGCTMPLRFQPTAWFTS